MQAVLNKTGDFHREICCDMCWDTIHTHFVCPACKRNYAGTSHYDNLINDAEHWDQKDFWCEECDTHFKIVSIEGEAVTLEWDSNEPKE